MESRRSDTDIAMTPESGASERRASRKAFGWLLTALAFASLVLFGASGAEARPAGGIVGGGSYQQPDCTTMWQRSGSGFYERNPVYVDDRDDSSDWQVATPTTQNMDGATLDAGIAKLARTSSLRSVIILRHGKLVEETYVNGGAADHARNVHSASKSMLQALIAIAVEDGFIDSLDDRAMRYLPPSYYRNASAAKKSITIRQLLRMRSGIKWTEDQTEYRIQKRSNWVKAIIARPMAATPGTRFNYSTGNTHILSAVLQGATEMSACEYAEQKLFTKLHITVEHWGRDPQGVYSGGYNLYLRPQELARFGQLYLQNGVWNGEQVVPPWAVRHAKTGVSDAGDGFFYSSGWWKRNISGYDMFFAWGHGGQFLYVIPELDIVFATTQDTAPGADGREINSGAFIENYLIPAVLDAP